MPKITEIMLQVTVNNVGVFFHVFAYFDAYFACFFPEVVQKQTLGKVKN